MVRFMSRVLKPSSMVARPDEELNSSTPAWKDIECVLRIAGKEGEPPHVALANLQKDYKAWKQFEGRWGDLIPPVKTTAAAEEGVEKEPHAPLDETLNEKLFNMAHGGVAYSFQDALRQAWKGDLHRLQYIQDQVAVYMRAEWKFERMRIRVIPENLWSIVCVTFLQDHAAGRTGVCENPNCPAPYFIKQRRTQKFCEAGPCVAYKQRLYALSWWNRKGKDKRAKKAGKSRGSRRSK